MLSHLRFHRRGASNPASPTTEHHHLSSTLSNHDSPLGPDSSSSSDAPPPVSSSSALPPTLPPIARVTSTDAGLGDLRLTDHDETSSAERRPQAPPPGSSGFIGGVALQNYRREVEAQQVASSYSVDHNSGPLDDGTWRQHLNPPSTSPEGQSKSHIKSPTSFATPTDLQLPNASATGRRPAGTRLSSHPSAPQPSSANPEAQRSRKGLPFLKNPMSTLLMRRKNNQNAPDLRPLPLGQPKDEPVYDPRIRGTRVHDFSAPRRKSKISSRDAPPAASNSRLPPPNARNERNGLADAGKRLQAVPVFNASQSRNPVGASDPAPSGASLAPPPPVFRSSSDPPIHTQDHHVQYTPELATGALPSSTPATEAPSHSKSEVCEGQVKEGVPQDMPLSHPSTRSARSSRSRNVSLSEISALPRHMKSTSSRFSFDMIGAAKQEKLLEEKHRKRERELEKKASAPEPATQPARDSRYDDFDEDAFDYDAMMDDDGLEERIPGVNADYEEEGAFDLEEEELDPDNDQENFAGFVFQRSNPTSSLASPNATHLITTPRDASGNVIGFAMTKDTPRSVCFPTSADAEPISLGHALNGNIPGLGIRGPVESDNTRKHDDLYFDDGLIDTQGEFAEDLAVEPEYDVAPFDESIFDNNDTDQYGRPVPGAFAQAQILRRAAAQDSFVKRESDVTSRFSAQSGTSKSTAHTSPTVEAHKDGNGTGEPLLNSTSSCSLGETQPSVIEADPMAAYQAALAAAAQNAAVSGKFHRKSSCSQDEEGSVEASSPTTYPTDPTDDGFGPEYDDIGDFELDDDAIIAEANASALANDSDGWYGQEFGFYSNPLNHHSVASARDADYEFANGGFFGPKGMNGLDRSASGRMVSREPNLTPITERSEYSNRNSLMSLGFPPLSSSTPAMQSPGLAQLAMMGDRGDDQMNLSALLRLRSKAWGGSQASLASSREGSPMSERGDLNASPWNPSLPGPLARPHSVHGRKNSALSVASRDSEGPSAPSSPTLTMSFPGFSSPCPANMGPANQTAFFNEARLPPSPVASANERGVSARGTPGGEAAEVTAPPTSRGSGSDQTSSSEGRGSMSETTRPSCLGHRRHRSSADSVSYLKEEESGETRWIVERRRTGESGEVEILEREVVEGGRI